MIRNKARKTLQAAAVASALLLAPVTSHAQNPDSAAAYRANYGDTSSGRRFDWGWLGLLGLLGLWPKRRNTVTETRTTGNPPR